MKTIETGRIDFDLKKENGLKELVHHVFTFYQEKMADEVDEFFPMVFTPVNEDFSQIQVIAIENQDDFSDLGSLILRYKWSYCGIVWTAIEDSEQDEDSEQEKEVFIFFGDNEKVQGVGIATTDTLLSVGKATGKLKDIAERNIQDMCQKIGASLQSQLYTGDGKTVH